VNCLKHEKNTPLTSVFELAALEMLDPREEMERLRDQRVARTDGARADTPSQLTCRRAGNFSTNKASCPLINSHKGPSCCFR
jgi:hypothetical protein